MARSTSPFEIRPYGSTIASESVDAITLRGADGSHSTWISYGATLTHLFAPDKLGAFSDIVLGLDDLEGYQFRSAFFGCTVGRFANRISNGRFVIDGTTYAVPLNSGNCHLHGGFRGYDKRIWNYECAMTGDGPSIQFSLLDPENTEGYPGNLEVKLIVTQLESCGIKLQYYARTDAPTPVNLTNHSYFNLRDGGASTILDQELWVDADSFLEVDHELIPTGEIKPVTETPMDFRIAKTVGQDIALTAIGFDHCYILNGHSTAPRKCLELFDPVSGRTLELRTTELGVQVYSANMLGEGEGKSGIRHGKRQGLCFEAQGYPDAPNHPHFPTTILSPNQTYRQITEYRLGTR